MKEDQQHMLENEDDLRRVREGCIMLYNAGYLLDYLTVTLSFSVTHVRGLSPLSILGMLASRFDVQAGAGELQSLPLRLSPASLFEQLISLKPTSKYHPKLFFGQGCHRVAQVPPSWMEGRCLRRVVRQIKGKKEKKRRRREAGEAEA